MITCALSLSTDTHEFERRPRCLMVMTSDFYQWQIWRLRVRIPPGVFWGRFFLIFWFLPGFINLHYLVYVVCALYTLVQYKHNRLNITRRDWNMIWIDRGLLIKKWRQYGHPDNTHESKKSRSRRCDGWRGDMVIRMVCEAVTKIKDKKKLEFYSLAGAASCSSLASDGLSAKAKNWVIGYCNAQKKKKILTWILHIRSPQCQVIAE